MNQRSYQTIDPLIMETLQLNERRIHHIFDILHGRDSLPQTHRPSLYQAKKNTSKMNNLNAIEAHKRVKSPRQITQKPKVRASSVKRINSPVHQIRTVEKSDILSIKEHPKSPKGRKETEKNAEEFMKKNQSLDKNNRLYMDYGRLRKNKTQQINPKDIYRLEVENILAKPTQIEDIEAGEKQIKRLKRRYKHLQRFDRQYFSRLNQADLVLI